MRPTRKIILDSISIMMDITSNMIETGVNDRIARRIHGLRKSSGLSLQALSAKCDVSRAAISLIERGESNPTAVILEKIAHGLGVSLASLFDDVGGDPDPVSTPTDRQIWQDPETGYKRCNISPVNFPSPIQIVEVELPAEATVAYETHNASANIHEQIWVRDGAVEVAHGDEVFHLNTGDCLAFKLDKPTRFSNQTQEPCRYLVIIAS